MINKKEIARRRMFAIVSHPDAGKYLCPDKMKTLVVGDTSSLAVD